MEKSSEAFPKQKWGRRCQACINRAQRARRRADRNAETKQYEKTPRGFLMRAYRNMQSRVTGVQWKKAHLYEGLSILPREDFYNWAWSNQDFWHLFRLWTAAGYDHKLTPSVNRVDTRKGYTLDNIEWLTHGVNSALANRSRMKTLEKVYALAG